jgi:hypothetical protein
MYILRMLNDRSSQRIDVRDLRRMNLHLEDIVTIFIYNNVTQNNKKAYRPRFRVI